MEETESEYLKSLSLDELIELHEKYDRLSHHTSRYDINQYMYFYDISKSIELEIERRQNNSKTKVRK